MTAETEHRRALVVVTAAAALLGASALVAISLFVAAVRADTPWDPIGDFPEQKVLAITDTVITVEGTKCYHEAVEVKGSFSWQSVDPPGTVLATRTGTALRQPGCITNVFENPIPPEVLAAETARGPIEWVITGSERPIDGERGIEGVPQVWRTEPFTLVD